MPCPYCTSTNYIVCECSDRALCTDCLKYSDKGVWRSDKRRRLTYPEGSHGARKAEQRAMGTTGATAESEHSIGYKVIAPTLGRGKCRCAKFVENMAPAYQEVVEPHRGHIGTGNHSDFHGTGQSSSDYRGDQARLLPKSPTDAIQLNQLHYAHQPGGFGSGPTLPKANMSYERHIVGLRRVIHQDPKDDSGFHSVPVSGPGKAEALLARSWALTGKLPSKTDEIKMMGKVGILPGSDEPLPQRGLPGAGRDAYGITTDGNCLFHAFYVCAEAMFGEEWGEDISWQDLRDQAVGFLGFQAQIDEMGLSGAYLDNMRLSRVYAGEPEVFALAQIWGVEIEILAPNYSFLYNQGRGRRITLHYNGVNHYSLGPNPAGSGNGGGAQKPPPKQDEDKPSLKRGRGA